MLLWSKHGEMGVLCILLRVYDFYLCENDFYRFLFSTRKISKKYFFRRLSCDSCRSEGGLVGCLVYSFHNGHPFLDPPYGGNTAHYRGRLRSYTATLSGCQIRFGGRYSIGVSSSVTRARGLSGGPRLLCCRSSFISFLVGRGFTAAETNYR